MAFGAIFGVFSFKYFIILPIFFAIEYGEDMRMFDHGK